MNQQKTAKKEGASRVSPEDYSKFISGLQLVHIRLREATCKLETDDVNLRRGVEVSTSDKASFTRGEASQYRVMHDYTLTAKYKDAPSALMAIHCIFELLFTFEVPPSDSYFQIFAKSSLPVFSWPYFREFVHATVGRMGLPPLVLPAIKRG